MLAGYEGDGMGFFRWSDGTESAQQRVCGSAPSNPESVLSPQPVLKHHATDSGVNPSSCPAGSLAVDGGCAPKGSPENP